MRNLEAADSLVGNLTKSQNLNFFMDRIVKIFMAFNKGPMLF